MDLDVMQVEVPISYIKEQDAVNPPSWVVVNNAIVVRNGKVMDVLQANLDIADIMPSS